jgi:hypothetical protein
MLTEQKRRFAYQVVTTGDLKKAAEFVGIDDETAAAWFADPEINEILVADRAAGLTTAMETRERVIARYAEVAAGDITDYFHDGGAEGEGGWFRLKDIKDLTPAQRRRIKKIKPTQHGIELELHDPMRANDKLAEIMKLFEANTDSESAEDKAKLLRQLADEMEGVTAGGGFTTH